MHLVELIATRDTDAGMLDNLESWLVSRLGKGVVRALDTPNFVANRVGVFSILAVMHHTQQFGLGFDVVDALTGPLIGRPKSATYRTADVVGLDTMAHVIKTMQDTLPDDPWHKLLRAPAWLSALIGKGALGQKTRCGIFKKDGKAIKVLDLAAQDYRDSAARCTRGTGHPQEQESGREVRPVARQSSIRRRSSCGRSSATSSTTRIASGRHRRQRARCRLRHALGLSAGRRGRSKPGRRRAGRRSPKPCKTISPPARR
jgi:3-hydroxyacyl-CoA dehydrogenase